MVHNKVHLANWKYVKKYTIVESPITPIKIITFEDTDSLTLNQILYLRRSGVPFNKNKKPGLQNQE